MKPPSRGIKGAVWRSVVTGGGVTADDVAAEMVPAFTLAGHGLTARLSAEDFRRRQVARIAHGLAAGFYAWRLRASVSRALARLTTEGWVQPVGPIRLTPMARLRLTERAWSPLRASYGHAGLAALLWVLAERERAPAEVLEALPSVSRSALYRTLAVGARAGLVALPQQRLPTLRSVQAWEAERQRKNRPGVSGTCAGSVALGAA